MVYYFRQFIQMNLRHDALKRYCLLDVINGFQGRAIAMTQKTVGIFLYMDEFANLANSASHRLLKQSVN